MPVKIRMICLYFKVTEGSVTCNPDSRFNRFCQIFIKIQDLSQDLKDFKSLEILLFLAVNTKIQDSASVI